MSDLLGATLRALKGGLRRFRGRTDHHSKFANGEYRFQACPHCGTWTPHTYTVMTDHQMEQAAVLAPQKLGMNVSCENCGVESIVLTDGWDEEAKEVEER